MAKKRSDSTSKKGENNIPENIKNQHILAEIRLLKIQAVVAILTVFGALVAFIITNHHTVKNLILSSKIKTKTNDIRILRNGKITISKIIEGDEKEVIKCSIKESTSWIKLKPGSYRVSLKYFDHNIWSREFLLQTGESEIIQIPDQFMGNIQVFVKIGKMNLLPTETLDITVETTGNGYLWVYEITDENRYSRIYPPKTTSNYCNEINVEEPFRFPDRKNLVLAAGDKEGKESLLFVITSVNRETFADEVISRVTDLSVVKTILREKEFNWGIAEITYNIKRIRQPTDENDTKF
ncbi:MAG: hypothetical protein PVH61_11845 [Candidatus Aminicenantes bacterium]|jgi:hypothetical protein